jgi:hypothetical protein
MSGCRQSASLRGGVFSKLVVSTLNTPLGNPAWAASSASAKTESGVSGDGLTIMQQPAANAAPAFRNTILNTSATYPHKLSTKLTQRGNSMGPEPPQPQSAASL